MSACPEECVRVRKFEGEQASALYYICQCPDDSHLNMNLYNSLGFSEILAGGKSEVGDGIFVGLVVPVCGA